MMKRNFAVVVVLVVVALALCSRPASIAEAKTATFTTFDPPGSVATEPFAINPAGAITGVYLDANGNQHGFLRARDGTFTSFDFPGSIFTVPFAINPAGAITGLYGDASGNVHGFLRSP